MEQDPLYRQMIQQSFILKKIPNLQIPYIRKKTKFKHEFVTTFTLTSIIYLILYPLDTIKTRIIANNKILDVAKFHANKTDKQTLYLGMLLGYGPIVIGNLCHLTVEKTQSLLLATVAQGLLKTWIDVSKISKQMANEKGDLDLMKKSFLPCTFFGTLRDIVYRFSTIFLTTKLQQPNVSFADRRKDVNYLFMTIIISTLISQPFEVCYIKMASQRSYHYRNPIQAVRQIWKEQGPPKLFLAGLWPRLLFNVASTLIIARTYQSFLNASVQAF